MAFAERTAEHREVLRIDEHQTPVDRAAAGHHAVAGDDLLGHAEVDGVVLDVHVEFLEAALVEKDLEPLARGQLALGVLRRDALFAPAHPRGGAATFEFCDVGGQGDPLDISVWLRR